MKSEVIFKVGVEGGSITLLGLRDNEVWRYHVETEDQTWMLLDEDDVQDSWRDGQGETRNATDLVDTWEKAVALLDRYPWHEFHPLVVNPAFLDRILAAVQKKYEQEGSERSLPDGELPLNEDRWRHAAQAY